VDYQQTFDNYCERQSDAFFAEPLNLLSNAAFLIAAYLACRYAVKERGSLTPSVAWLCLLLFVVGIGSSLFHSFATLWAMLSDTIPIQIFILSFFWFWQRSVLSFPLIFCYFGVLLLYLGTSHLAFQLQDLPLNGSEGYIGALVALVAIGLQRYYSKKEGKLLLVASVFTLSIAARSVDESFCEFLPIGTHFIWHLLNAFVCYSAICCYSSAQSTQSKLDKKQKVVEQSH